MSVEPLHFIENNHKYNIGEIVLCRLPLHRRVISRFNGPPKDEFEKVTIVNITTFSQVYVVTVGGLDVDRQRRVTVYMGSDNVVQSLFLKLSNPNEMLKALL